jgi:hypothetical protein
VRDVHQRHAARFQPLDLLEQQVDFARGQHRSGFVENQHAAVADQIARDLDHLLMPDTQCADQRVGIDRVEADLRHGVPRVLAQLGAVDPAEHAALRQTVQKQVLGHGESGQQIQLLHDHAHAERLGVLAAGRRVGRAAEGHRAGSRRDQAADDFGQGALARAVFAGQRQHFARAQFQRDIGEHGLGIGLADTVHAQHGRGFSKR